MIFRLIETIIWLGVGYMGITALLLFFEQRNFF